MSSLKHQLKNILTPEELAYVKTSYDILGDVAIVEIPSELEHKEKEIAEAVVKIHKRVKVVAKKVGAVSGDFRVRPLKIILCLRDASNCNTETVLKENGVLMRLNPTKVFYSIRLGTERERIAEMVKDGEHVLIMFAGIGPFAFVIAREKTANIIAVEWNPDAIEYMKESLLLNKKLKGNIVPILGDVRKVVPTKFSNWADRIIMPLPKTADSFLDIAVIASKSNALIHTYVFMDSRSWKSDLEPWLEKRCNEICNKLGHNIKLKLESAHIVRPYAPKIVQIGIILKVKKIKLNNL